MVRIINTIEEQQTVLNNLLLQLNDEIKTLDDIFIKMGIPMNKRHKFGNGCSMESNAYFDHIYNALGNYIGQIHADRIHHTTVYYVTGSTIKRQKFAYYWQAVRFLINFKNFS